jgi:hypothetical protein
LILFYLKEQETIKVVVDEGAAVQNTCLNHTSVPEEGISESYTAINTFSELLTVIFQSNTHFLWIIHGHYAELLFF